MIVDDDKQIRKKAYDQIIGARKQRINLGLVGKLREFEKPTHSLLETGTEHYTQIIDCDNCDYNETKLGGAAKIQR